MDENLKQEIIDIAKKEGLHVAEESAVLAVKAAFAIIKVVVPKISSGLGVIILPIVEYVEPKVIDMLDAIDGVEG